MVGDDYLLILKQMNVLSTSQLTIGQTELDIKMKSSDLDAKMETSLRLKDELQRMLNMTLPLKKFVEEQEAKLEEMRTEFEHGLKTLMHRVQAYNQNLLDCGGHHAGQYIEIPQYLYMTPSQRVIETKDLRGLNSEIKRDIEMWKNL
jgi:hypothetical protein